MSHYSHSDVRDVLLRLGVQTGETVFTHANLGMCGILKGASSPDEVCETFLSVLMELLGAEGTLIVPAYSYSFPRGEVFSIEATPSACGTFSNFVLTRKIGKRSADPCFSVVVLGRDEGSISSRYSGNSFDKDSVFADLLARDAKILNFNLDAGSTFLHFIERELRVPYRFDKTFEGRIEKPETGSVIVSRATIWVRYLSDRLTEENFVLFDRIARERGACQVETLGRGTVSCISSSESNTLLRELYAQNPWVLTKAAESAIKPKLVPEPTLKLLSEFPLDATRGHL